MCEDLTASDSVCKGLRSRPLNSDPLALQVGSLRLRRQEDYGHTGITGREQQPGACLESDQGHV